MLIHLTLEQHRFELRGTTPSQLVGFGDAEPPIPRNQDTEELCTQRADYKLHIDFQLWGGWEPLTPSLFKGQLYC